MVKSIGITQPLGCVVAVSRGGVAGTCSDQISGSWVRVVEVHSWKLAVGSPYQHQLGCCGVREPLPHGVHEAGQRLDHGAVAKP